jgi:hypothetical protein
MVSNSEDMTLSVPTRGLHLIVQNIVKGKLFCNLKFFDKRNHGSYSTKPNTVCGMLIKLGNISSVQADYKWWDTMCSTVMHTHANHRNNCVKAMWLCFQGICRQSHNCGVRAMCLFHHITYHLFHHITYHKTLCGGRMSYPKSQCRQRVSQNFAQRV